MTRSQPDYIKDFAEKFGISEDEARLLATHYKKLSQIINDHITKAGLVDYVDLKANTELAVAGVLSDVVGAVSSVGGAVTKGVITLAKYLSEEEFRQLAKLKREFGEDDLKRFAKQLVREFVFDNFEEIIQKGDKILQSHAKSIVQSLNELHTQLKEDKEDKAQRAAADLFFTPSPARNPQVQGRFKEALELATPGRNSKKTPFKKRQQEIEAELRSEQQNLSIPRTSAVSRIGAIFGGTVFTENDKELKSLGERALELSLNERDKVEEQALDAVIVKIEALSPKNPSSPTSIAASNIAEKARELQELDVTRRRLFEECEKDEVLEFGDEESEASTETGFWFGDEEGSQKAVDVREEWGFVDLETDEATSNSTELDEHLKKFHALIADDNIFQFFKQGKDRGKNLPLANNIKVSFAKLGGEIRSENPEKSQVTELLKQLKEDVAKANHKKKDLDAELTSLEKTVNGFFEITPDAKPTGSKALQLKTEKEQRAERDRQTAILF